jgi:hypothetical protein
MKRYQKYNINKGRWSDQAKNSIEHRASLDPFGPFDPFDRLRAGRLRAGRLRAGRLRTGKLPGTLRPFDKLRAGKLRASSPGTGRTARAWSKNRISILY